MSDLPRNYGLVDAARLDVAAQLRSLSVREGDRGARQLATLAKLWLDASDLELSRTVIGRGATEPVVEGTYEGRPVRSSVVHALRSAVRTNWVAVVACSSSALHDACPAVSQVAVKVVSLSNPSQPVRQALMREAVVVLKVSGECRHTCQYKGATIKDNEFCLVMRR